MRGALPGWQPVCVLFSVPVYGLTGGETQGWTAPVGGISFVAELPTPPHPGPFEVGEVFLNNGSFLGPLQMGHADRKGKPVMPECWILSLYIGVFVSTGFDWDLWCDCAWLPTRGGKCRLLRVNPQYGNTPLLWAALNGHASTMKLLLNRGASANAANEVRGNAVLVSQLTLLVHCGYACRS